ncbi:hypothetical protein B0T19DRAFT_440802 [Cercophora scortea]|uniref:Uncharacterized protein n=1 Tax=Cercophora scortea TaxID=314031 RepID=A0AAE0IZJ9_9PEZI|nr:hypothetical protein B0T19DRAFT_440802 [Cercophora scortea]
MEPVRSSATSQAGAAMPSERPERYRNTAIKLNLRPLDSIDVTTLKPEPTPIRIEDKGELSSFSKLSDNAIGVPGFSMVNPEADYEFRDLKLFNFPTYTHPFEPLIQSIYVADPDFNLLATADIVTNASNLRKLFHMFQNQREMTERYDLAWRDNTLFLSKWTGDPSLKSSLGRGAGFEKETCQYMEDDDEALKNSCSHHRVVCATTITLKLVTAIQDKKRELIPPSVYGSPMHQLLLIYPS